MEENFIVNATIVLIIIGYPMKFLNKLSNLIYS